ncbi:RagB/SusD family nutrient uptake outer membrane protein [Flavobacterium granuli]|nr:RagB/SusD family nutrient uptake outer membrane protein [Flavobacterium granuli]
MKKLIYIVMLLPFFGCSNFLDEVDQDKLVPEKTDQFAALLLKEFNAEYPIFRTVDYMTDNMIEDPKALSSAKNSMKTTFTWQREIEIDEEGNQLSTINDAWQKMYEDVAIANYVLNLIDGADGTQEEKDFIKGEAYFIRAMSYFNLVNLYGQPYNSATANAELGVPLREGIGVEVSYSRNTVAECYAFIESDLTNAKQLIQKSGLVKSKWHPSSASCDLLMSRVKLYQAKWDETISNANAVIAKAGLSRMTANVPFITAGNSEVLYSYYTVAPLMKLISSGFGTPTVAYTVAEYYANKELINLYDANDNRKDSFFKAFDDGTGRFYYRTKKYEPNYFTSMGYANFRVAEAYLNRAEAYAQKGDVANAINDIKALQASRYSNVSGIVYPTDPQEVLKYVLTERRKELCFEDHHRWFDLRRMKNRPEIKHVFSLVGDDGRKIGTETYTLFSDDKNYTLPIPLKERENNPIIRNNERYEKIPSIDNVIIIN